MSKRAVILTGGKGIRLRPYTVALPKSLMPVGDYPILEIIVKQLAQCGFDHITMAVNHQADIIKAFFGAGDKWQVSIDYSLENEPLGTMGPLKLVHDLPKNFLVMNGDILTDLNFAHFLTRHSEHNRLFTVSSYTREQVVDFGVLKPDQSGQLVGFTEKPRSEYEVSMGIYAVNRSALSFIPDNQRYGFDELMLALIGAKQFAQVERHKGFWLDIGRPDDYMQAVDCFEDIRSKLLR